MERESDTEIIYNYTLHTESETLKLKAKVTKDAKNGKSLFNYVQKWEPVHHSGPDQWGQQNVNK